MQLRQPARHKQAGFSAIEILLVVLVIAALAATVLMVYQRHKPSIAKNSAASIQTQTTTQPAQTTTQYLTIKEWGVKLPLSDAIKDVYYVPGISSKGADGLPNQMWVGLKSLDGNGCTATNNSGPALIFRALPSDTDPISGKLLTQKYPNGVTIGSYYYGYEDFTTSSSTTCKAAQTTLQAIDSAFAAAAKGIVAALATQYLDIKEWGIKVQLEDAVKLTYTMHGTPNGTSANADGIVSYAALSLKDSITSSPKCMPLTTSISQHFAASNIGEGANMTTVGKYAYGIDGGTNSCDDTAINALQQKIFSELLKRGIVAE